jgi:GAF domain-containing protein
VVEDRATQFACSGDTTRVLRRYREEWWGMTEFLEDFARMALELHDESTVDETVERVLEYALKAVHADYAGVVFFHHKKQVETTAATDPLVAELNGIQVECGEGPDIDLTDRYSVIVSDTHAEQRWPTWAKRVAEAGIRSLLSVRLYTSSSTVGMLNLYDREPDKFDVSDQEVAHVLARHAAVALASARQTENLWQAIDARKRVGQAQGILMERFDLNEDQAFAVLMRYSQNNNIKLREVAERLISTRHLPQ